MLLSMMSTVVLHQVFWFNCVFDSVQTGETLHSVELLLCYNLKFMTHVSIVVLVMGDSETMVHENILL